MMPAFPEICITAYRDAKIAYATSGWRSEELRAQMLEAERLMFESIGLGRLPPSTPSPAVQQRMGSAV